MNIPAYADELIPLDAMGSWPKGVHRLDPMHRLALQAAEAAGRPLLVRGEPGTGKSQLAQAAACASRRRLISFVVDSRTEPTDLLWRYDAVARLADAQLGAHALDGHGKSWAQQVAPYVTPGPMWWALDADGARQHETRSGASDPAPPPAEWKWQVADGCVLLIDEIDKAENEVPNALLEALGNGQFSIPMLSTVVSRPEADPPPLLIVITSNDERELPPAFERRCLQLTIELPGDGKPLQDYLLSVARAHRDHGGSFARVPEPVMRDAAKMLVQDRTEARRQGIYVPGVAEYLDLLRALDGVHGEPAANLTLLRRFAYKVTPASPD